jgi:hypothetical protein
MVSFCHPTFIIPLSQGPPASAQATEAGYPCACLAAWVKRLVGVGDVLCAREDALRRHEEPLPVSDTGTALPVKS